MGYITKNENLVLCTDRWEGVGAVVDIIHNFASDLQRVHTPSRTAEQATAIRRIPDKRGRKNEEMYVDVFGFCILHLKTLFVPTETTCSDCLLSQVCVEMKHSLYCVCLQGGFSMFIQLMPIVVLILVSILSQMMVSPPPYSLYSRPYVHTHTHTPFHVVHLYLAFLSHFNDTIK